MDSKWVFSFLMWVASIFSVVCLYSAFDPLDNYLIDCGSPTNTTVGARLFLADSLSTKYLSTQTNILANSSPNSSLDFLPYQTARIFLGNSSSTYTFPISQPGRHWIRFYFSPFAHTKYNMNLAKFSVSTQSYTLLANFTPSGTGMKEYSINISSSSLIITFTPSKNSLAFINALELVSVPDTLIIDNATTTEGGKFQGLFSQALETMARVNMGGLSVSSEDDTLWRAWVPDQRFLTAPNLADFVSNISAVKYREGGVTNDTAPALVYGTATAVRDANFNVTWEFTVDPGFKYMVRFHFCDIVSEFHELHFYVYINSSYAFPGFDWCAKNIHILGIACYIDFITASAVGRKLHISISPSTSYSGYRNAFLNGLEIMKMNNSVGSLSGVNNMGSSSNARSKKNVGSIVGASVGVLVAVVVVVVFLFWLHKKRTVARLPNMTTTSEGSNLRYRVPFAVVQKATRNFDGSLVIGTGGFGKVYRGALSDGTLVAIKRGNPKSQQGEAEFQTEIEMLSHLHHRHLVSLIGYCDENNEKILIYQYMENGTLSSHLYGSGLPSLGWKERLEICIGAARGLHYLHENTVIHRDVKATNILLDENLCARVSDFGISKLVPEIDKTHVTTTVKGSFGYLDPEYALTRQLREKSDVYSFGVVLLEVLCARPVIDPSLPKEMVNLPKWALEWQNKGQIEHVIDPFLAGKIRPLSLRTFAETAARCLAEIGVQRPSMGEVIWNLEHVLQLQDTVLENDPKGKKAMIDGECSRVDKSKSP